MIGSIGFRGRTIAGQLRCLSAKEKQARVFLLLLEAWEEQLLQLLKEIDRLIAAAHYLSCYKKHEKSSYSSCSQKQSDHLLFRFELAHNFVKKKD